MRCIKIDRIAASGRSSIWKSSKIIENTERERKRMKRKICSTRNDKIDYSYFHVKNPQPARFFPVCSVDARRGVNNCAVIFKKIFRIRHSGFWRLGDYATRLAVSPKHSESALQKAGALANFILSLICVRKETQFNSRSTQSPDSRRHRDTLPSHPSVLSPSEKHR